MAYELIETIEVGAGGAASIEFTSIPQDGTDLVCLLSVRASANPVSFRAFLNNDTTSNYKQVNLRGNGSSVDTSSTGTGTTGSFVLGFAVLTDPATSTANTFINAKFQISNYTTSQAKSGSVDLVDENNATNAGQMLVAPSYLGTSPITSISVDFLVGNFVQYSTASLYKIS